MYVKLKIYETFLQKFEVQFTKFLNNFNTEIKPKSNLHFTRDITPKRVTSGRVHLLGLAPGQSSSKKRRSGGEPMVTLWISNHRPPALIACTLTSEQTGPLQETKIDESLSILDIGF